MQLENHPATQSSSTAPAFDKVNYMRRMRFIQRWRRTALLVCLFLSVYALAINMLDPASTEPSTFALIQSSFLFIIAVLVAVNFLTFQLRK